MKAAVFALLFLCIFDFAVNHGAGTRHAVTVASGLAHGVGTWVYYS